MIPSSFVRSLMVHVNFLPLCPEMEIGLPSPRESLRLINSGNDIRLKSYIKGIDYTGEMIGYAQNMEEKISTFKPDGFILKSRSPSCGIKDVKVYASIGKAPPLNFKSSGIFGNMMSEYYPDTIIEDEGR
ncbi:MAG: DUF523 domain-containing protein, partial [Clostridia bacterium]|nr:DUF523 domain-containing protein [Clostridia bacterium]